MQVQGIRGSRNEIERACKNYGFHPLSLRLLAGLVANDFHNPGDIKAAQNIDVSGDLIQRQHHILEQSYSNLTSERRQLLSQLACFRSSVNISALEAVVKSVSKRPKNKQFRKTQKNKRQNWKSLIKKLKDNSSDVKPSLKTVKERIGILHADLKGLIARGLVQRDESRLDLHPIVRRYVYDQMSSSEKINTHDRLRNYFAAVPKPNKVRALEDLTLVVELYHHMVKAEQYEEAYRLWHERLWKQLYYQLGAYELYVELLEGLIEGNGVAKLPKNYQAKIFGDLGSGYARRGKAEESIKFFQKSIEIYKKINRKEYWALALGNLAYGAEFPIGALKSAEANLRLSIRCFQNLKKSDREAEAYIKLGQLLSYKGNWKEAQEVLDKSLELLERSNYLQPQGIVWSVRSVMNSLQQRFSKSQKDLSSDNFSQLALDAAVESLKFAEQTASQIYPVERDFIRAHWCLSVAYRLNHNLQKSEHHATEALRRCRSVNDLEAESDILIDFAKLCRDQGDSEKALHLAQECKNITDRCGYALQGADCHIFLAEQAIADSNRAQACELADRAFQLATCDDFDYRYKVAYAEAELLLRRLKVI